MITYFYFTMAVITWDWYWFMTIPEWSYQQRIALVIMTTFSLLMDLIAIYELSRFKRKR